MAPRKAQSKRSGGSSDEEYDKLNPDNEAFWDAVAGIPIKLLVTPGKKLGTRTEIRSGSSRGQEQGSNRGRSPVSKAVHSVDPPVPMVAPDALGARGGMSKALLPAINLGSPPMTPRKKAQATHAPSTERTRAITQALGSLRFSSPTKKERRDPPPRSSRTNAGPTPQPAKAVYIEVSSDDEEEEEVNDMPFETDSSPPTRPGSLFDYSTSQSSGFLTTPASSWSVGDRGGQGPWSSSESEPTTNVAVKQKHLRSSDASEIEIHRINNGFSAPALTNDVFATPRISKFRDAETSSSQKLLPSAPPSSNDIPSAVSVFFHGTLGTDLKPIIIAHCAKVQEFMDKHNFAWGVQYEFARGVSLKQWTWDDVFNVLRVKLNEFEGSNADTAYKVGPIMRQREARNVNLTLWQELDREQAAILENKGRGLGLMGRWHDQDDWFGGRIQQIARLSKEGTQYRVHLEPMEKRRSHRFSRYLGSRRMLQLRISKDLIMKENTQLKKFLQGKFILCGRVYVPFHAKDHSLYMVETNENWERKTRTELGDQYRHPFSDFINWHNPPEHNHKQALSKYVTRYALGLSTSIPVLEFEGNHIYFVDDIYGSHYKGGKASAEETMTDGCGFINQAALVAINAKLNKQSLPVAVQGRIAGAKGLWLLHPHDTSSEFKIWIRDSQNKIHLPTLDRSHRIFELVSPSKPSFSVSLSRQSIVNLSFNGVPDKVLMDYLEKGLEEEIRPLVDWDRPKALLHLWHAINNTGNVARSRVERVTTGISRALGLTRRVWNETEESVGDGGDAFNEANRTHSGREEYSQAPNAVNESALELVQAGFHPSQLKCLRDKLKYIIEGAIKSVIEGYRIPLSESLSGFVVPDPLGVLEEGEIYYRSSQSLLDPRTQRTFDILTGDVIVGRYPIFLASDLQKVRAVNISELYQWPDVIIASTKGTRSLASLLSGGDMDGDELFILREPELVEPFRGTPFVSPPDDLSTNFKKHVETVNEFCERIKHDPPTLQQTELQSALLLSLNEDQKGLYSTFHDNAVEKYGYNHPKTVRLSYMFNTLLDASKSGLTLRDGIFEMDRKAFGNGPFMEDEYYDDLQSPSIRRTRPQNPGQIFSILTKLVIAGERKGEELMAVYASAAGRSTNRLDQDLAAPYDKALAFAHAAYGRKKELAYLLEDLSKIRKHVDGARNIWAELCSKPKGKKKTKSGKSSSSSSPTEQAITAQAARLFAAEVEGIIATPNVDEIKASYAYREWPDSPFAFSMAFRQLCEIKGRAARGGLAPCIREIDEMKTISGSNIRAVERSYTD